MDKDTNQRIVPGYCVYRCSETVHGRPLLTDIRREHQYGCQVWTCLNCMLPRYIPAIFNPLCVVKAHAAATVTMTSSARLARSFRTLLAGGNVPDQFFRRFFSRDLAALIGEETYNPVVLGQTIKCLLGTGEITRIRYGVYRCERKALCADTKSRIASKPLSVPATVRTILSIDPGTKTTGYALVSRNTTLVESGVLHPGKPGWHAELDQLITAADWLVIETPYLALHRNVRTLMVQSNTIGGIRAAWDRAHGYDTTTEVAAGKWQGSYRIGGQMKRAARKVASVQLARMLAGVEVGPDEADAILMGLWFARNTSLQK